MSDSSAGSGRQKRSFALRAAFRTSSIWGMQLLASATALMRGQILPPSEMKSLYGSTTSSAVMSLSYVGVSTLFPPALTELPRFADSQFLDAIRSMRAAKNDGSPLFCDLYQPAASRIRFAIVSGCDMSET